MMDFLHVLLTEAQVIYLNISYILVCINSRNWNADVLVDPRIWNVMFCSVYKSICKL